MRQKAQYFDAEHSVKGKVDFHMHSVFSDGTDSVPLLLEKVKKAGITAFSLTDHDAYRGCVQMRSLLAASQVPLFVPGIEFSSEDAYGKYHILGYGFDTENSEVTSLADYCHESRLTKAQKRLEFLKNAFGFTFTDSEIDGIFRQNNPGKPHIARLMVSHGYALSIDDAICRFLAQYPGKDDKVTPEEAIRAVAKAGGISVLAHGWFGNGSQRLSEEQMRTRTVRLAGFGLGGLECFYSGFSEEQAAYLCGLCDELKLFVTAGSDYHGDIKNVRLGALGTYPTASEAASAHVQKFLNAMFARQRTV